MAGLAAVSNRCKNTQMFSLKNSARDRDKSSGEFDVYMESEIATRKCVVPF